MSDEVSALSMVDPRNLPIFLTVKETAQILRLKLSTTYRYVRQGLIPAVRLGRLIRIPGSKILEMAGLGVTGVLGTRSTNLKMPGLSVRDFFRQYLATAAQRTRKSTVQTYRLAFAAFAGYIGRIPLAELTTRDVQLACGELRKRLAPATCRLYLQRLSTALNEAVKWGYIDRNPARGVKLPPRDGPEKEILTEEEVERFCAAARKSRYYALLLLGVATGMRVGEILALRWRDLDLNAGIVRVGRTLSLGEYVPPKSRAGRRQILLDAVTLAALREHRRQQEQLAARRGGRLHGEGLVFVTRTGRPLTRVHVNYALRRIVKRAGIDKKITFHGLRHTHATYLLQRGIPVRDVAARLGHADPAMTLRTYAHATTEGQRRAAKAIEDLLRDGDLFAVSEI